MLDRDLAALYGVATGNLNLAVRRNIKRFPEHYMFQLTKTEFENLMLHFAISSWGGVRKLPYAFTEQGVAMLSSILKSERAIAINIRIIDTFVALRRASLAVNNSAQIKQLREILFLYMEKNDKRVDDIILALNALIEKPEKEIGRIGFAVDN
jgi:hypothetical protein